MAASPVGRHATGTTAPPLHTTETVGLARAVCDPGASLTDVFMGLERVTSTRPSLGWAWLDSALIALRQAARMSVRTVGPLRPEVSSLRLVSSPLHRFKALQRRQPRSRRGIRQTQPQRHQGATGLPASVLSGLQKLSPGQGTANSWYGTAL